jgi:predicted RNA binding protein YcfA (HicA-like mRNA interferase family)
MFKVTSLKQLESILKENGYVLMRIGKHSVWGREEDRIVVPLKHNHFNRRLAEDLLKKAKYISFSKKAA